MVTFFLSLNIYNWFKDVSFSRSILSSVIPAHEIGRVFSVLALFSATSGSLVEALFQVENFTFVTFNDL